MINLKLYNQHEIDDRITMSIWQWLAWDKATGAYMSSSAGRRKAGRARKYFAKFGDTEIRFTAQDEYEAVAIANKRLNEKSAKYQVVVIDTDAGTSYAIEGDMREDQAYQYICMANEDAAQNDSPLAYTMERI